MVSDEIIDFIDYFLNPRQRASSEIVINVTKEYFGAIIFRTAQNISGRS
jgi:hypothetical protein